MVTDHACYNRIQRGQIRLCYRQIHRGGGGHGTMPQSARKWQKIDMPVSHGWRNDFREGGGNQAFQRPKISPPKTEKSSDLTYYFFFEKGPIKQTKKYLKNIFGPPGRLSFQEAQGGWALEPGARGLSPPSRRYIFLFTFQKIINFPSFPK